jgi:hypothetical protein
MKDFLSHIKFVSRANKIVVQLKTKQKNVASVLTDKKMYTLINTKPSDLILKVV